MKTEDDIRKRIAHQDQFIRDSYNEGFISALEWVLAEEIKIVRWGENKREEL